MFLSLPSVEKGRSLTGFSLSNCFGHNSFHWWNKFLPNASEQPQTQQPCLQPHGGTLPHSGTFGCCVLAWWLLGEGIFISPVPLGVSEPSLLFTGWWSSAQCRYVLLGFFRLLWVPAALQLCCTSAQHSKHFFMRREKGGKKRSALKFLSPWDWSELRDYNFSN